MLVRDYIQGPRASLGLGELAVGQVAVGPDDYWRVPLDEATLTWRGNLLVLSGKETLITVHGETVISCVRDFWEGFARLWMSIDQGHCDLAWLSDPDSKTEFARAIDKRFRRAIATPPCDGAAYDLLGEFWDDRCPPWKNPYPTPLGGPVPF